MVGHQPANFGDNRYCGKIDAFSLWIYDFSVCHVILQGHVINWSCDYIYEYLQGEPPTIFPFLVTMKK